ncbi:TonB-dependent receptor domain-containing protein [Sphingobium sp. WCS2017Hpa-17]|uniref:TonB-dependent receptor n=1 Tax=Sphingobium sp. WCS2017Hpa-17 TaxID=3073638 RepID=UPI00288C42E4|nr:TonB-dependent receptor [Sphingobium sp. WCS2017Hpa-17]
MTNKKDVLATHAKQGASICSMVVMSLSGLAQAQTTPQDPVGLQDIVVTAQKREENLQRVPVAVTALTSEALENQRITSVAGLGSVVPNFQVLRQPSNAALPSFSLRGVLGGETAAQIDNGVSIYIDGVYLGRSSGSLFDIADIERIEVLRGPQGTLFGRNTTGGAVNFITRGPTGEFGVRQDLTYGRYDEVRSRTRIDLPEVAGFKASVTYAHREVDGYVRNLAAGVERNYGPGTGGRIGTSRAADTLGAENVDSVFVAVRHDSGGPLTADYKFDFTDFRGSQLGMQAIGFRGSADVPGSNPLGGTVQYIFSLQPGLGGTNVVSTSPLSAIYDPQRGTDRLRAQGHSLTLAYEASDAVTIKNITAYRRLETVSYGNSFDGNKLIDPFGGTGNDFSVLNAISRRKQHQYSNEFQMLGKSDRFNWVAGAFFFEEHGRDYNPVQFFKTFPPQGEPVPVTASDQFADARVTNRSFALFAQGSFRISDRFTLTAGARQTWDKRREINYLATPAAKGSASFDQLTWQVVGEFQATPDIMLYAKAGTGYLSGGIYNGKPFGAEKLISYEAGVKSQLWDNRLRLNLAAFLADYDDLQVSVFTTVLNFENAGKARIRGLEAELVLAPVEGLQVGANLGLLDFDYRKYISTAATGTPEDISDIAVRQQTPKMTFAPNASFETRPMANGARLSFQLDASYRSDVRFVLIPFADPALDRAATSQAHWIVNGRVSLLDLPIAGSKVKLSAWGQNLFNKRVVQYASDISGFVAASFNRPRTYGIDASMAF